MIQRTMSTWASPVIIMPKKGLELPKDPGTPLPVTAKLRLVCDYRILNKKLPADFWSYDKESRRIKKHGINAPYPTSTHWWDASIDSRSQISDDTRLYRRVPWAETISPDAAKKSAFITHIGKFEWNVAPFGLALLPSYYSKAMQDTLSGLEDFAGNYMDDVLIGSYSEKEHLDHIRQVFERFHKFKMKLKLAKCEFGWSEIQFLGHIINHKGIKTLPEKTEEISKIKAPRNADKVCAFLGLLKLLLPIYPIILRLDVPNPETPEKEHKIWMVRGMRQSIQDSKGNAHERPHSIPPRPQPTLDHWNRCQQDSVHRCVTTTTHPWRDKTRSPSDIHIVQLHWYSASLECHRMWTLHNICSDVQIKLHDKRWQSNNKNWSQTSTGNSSRNSQIPKFGSSRQILSLDQWHPSRRPTSYIADSLSRLRMGEHHNYDVPLHNTEPIILKNKAEINMVTTHTKSAEQDQLTLKLPELQIKVRDIFKTSD